MRCNVAASISPPLADALTHESVVLITGAAGFLGSELAMALHRVYEPKKILVRFFLLLLLLLFCADALFVCLLLFFFSTSHDNE